MSVQHFADFLGESVRPERLLEVREPRFKNAPRAARDPRPPQLPLHELCVDCAVFDEQDVE